jgi:DUF4097 and DUF4098 domain-containing protein YvlB
MSTESMEGPSGSNKQDKTKIYKRKSSYKFQSQQIRTVNLEGPEGKINIKLPS